MTEKRFTYLDASRNKYIGSFFCNSVPLTNDEVTNHLNKLYNENQDLKEENQKLRELLFDPRRITNEVQEE